MVGVWDVFHRIMIKKKFSHEHIQMCTLMVNNKCEKDVTEKYFRI